MSPYNWVLLVSEDLPVFSRDANDTCIDAVGTRACINQTAIKSDWDTLSDGAHAGIIVGASVGGTLILVMILFLIWRCLRRRRGKIYMPFLYLQTLVSGMKRAEPVLILGHNSDSLGRFIVWNSHSRGVPPRKAACAPASKGSGSSWR